MFCSNKHYPYLKMVKIENYKKEKDNINPSHYKQGEIECIQAIKSATINKQGLEAFCIGNVIKYLWRYESKGGLQDIEKAKWYLDRLIEIKKDTKE